MVDIRRLFLPGMDKRIDALLRSNPDLRAYAVSSARLRDVIRESAANDKLKRQVITFLERRVIKGRATVHPTLLGMAVAEFTEKTDDEDILVIANDLNNLNKLPLIIANGRSVS
jgi:hypothetical protein